MDLPVFASPMQGLQDQLLFYVDLGDFIPVFMLARQAPLLAPSEFLQGHDQGLSVQGIEQGCFRKDASHICLLDCPSVLGKETAT